MTYRMTTKEDINVAANRPPTTLDQVFALTELAEHLLAEREAYRDLALLGKLPCSSPPCSPPSCGCPGEGKSRETFVDKKAQRILEKEGKGG